MITASTDDFRCYNHGPGKFELMRPTKPGELACPCCPFTVRLHSTEVPAAWYASWDDPPEFLSLNDPCFPVCAGCGTQMTAICSSKGPIHGMESIFFACIKDGKRIHRMEGYFRPLSSQDLSLLKSQLKQAAFIQMMWELLGRDCDVDSILRGPATREVDLSSLPESERSRKVSSFRNMKAVGILMEVHELSSEKLRVTLDKNELARAFADVVPCSQTRQ